MIAECNLLMVRGINNRLIEMVLFCCSDCVQMFDWDQDNVIVTGSTDGIVRVRPYPLAPWCGPFSIDTLRYCVLVSVCVLCCTNVRIVFHYLLCDVV